jgi:hypothetical protein
MEEYQCQIKAKTQELIDRGKSLCLIKDSNAEVPQEETLLPARVSVDPQHHKTELISLRDSIPAITKEIKILGGKYSATTHNLSLPNWIQFEQVKKSLSVVEERIFTVELYCGLQEQVKQIGFGEPASESEPISVRQLMLYMDEETLWDYKTGGMDFEKLEDFDKWIVEPSNLNRLLPEKRGVVAFRIRRFEKDYGHADSLYAAMEHIAKHEANMKTYLLLRNGDRVYRIASAVDFSPRLVPKLDEIGEKQFQRTHRKYVGTDKHGFPTGEHEVITTIAPDDIRYDECVEKLDRDIKHYNKMVILLQGLLDRSEVFNPHPRVNLCKPDSFEQWVKLIRDEEQGLPSNKVSWEEYRKQLAHCIKTGVWVYVDQTGLYKYKESKAGRRTSDYSSFWSNSMPTYIKVSSVNRERTMVRVSWPQGAKKYGVTTTRRMHELVPIEFVFPVEAYTPGDYRMFLFSHEMKVEYRKWAKYLLSAEDWVQKEKQNFVNI